MKRVIKNSCAVYESPTAENMKFEDEGILCASSELQDLEKESFDFGWEN
jgi:hypothetical protein